MGNKFCGNCGAASTGAAFCTSCGAPMQEHTETRDSADATRVMPAAAPQAPAPAVQPGAAGSGPAAASNPFAGIPAGDYVRDAVSGVLLLVSLTLAWDMMHEANDRWWVVLATVASLASLGLPYLVRAGVIPGWSADQLTMAKLFTNAPYALVVVIAVVNELVNLQDYAAGGLGAAVAVGTAGMVLALQPRANEDAARHELLWWKATVGLAAAAIGLMVLTTLVFLLTSLDEAGSFGGMDQLLLYYIVVVLTALGLALAVIGRPVLGIVQRDEAWRRVYLTVGIGISACVVLASFDSESTAPFFQTLSVEKFAFPAAGFFLIPASIAAAASVPVTRRMQAADPVQVWLRTAGHALTVLALTVGLVVVAGVVTMIQSGAFSGSALVRILIALGFVGAALVGRAMLRTPTPNRMVAVVVSGLLLLLAIVYLAVARNDTMQGIDPLGMAFWITMPALVLFSLTAPRAVRESMGPLRQTAPAASSHGQG